MKFIYITLTWLSLIGPAFANDVYVNGYYRNNGTYVEPYHRSAPDSSPYNNYSTQGNINPYTGARGTVNPYNNNSSPSSNYNSNIYSNTNLYGSNPYGGYGN